MCKFDIFKVYNAQVAGNIYIIMSIYRVNNQITKKYIRTKIEDKIRRYIYEIYL